MSEIDALYLSALSHFSFDNYNQALSSINSLLVKSDYTPKFLLFKTCCLLKLGCFSDAGKTLDEIHEGDRKSFEFLLLKGKTEFYAENFEAAKKHFAEAAESVRGIDGGKEELAVEWERKVENEL